MTSIYESKIKKDKKRVKRRVKITTTIDDYITNLLIDLKNYQNKVEVMAKAVEKLSWYGNQINHNVQEILLILQDNNIYTTVMKKKRL